MASRRNYFGRIVADPPPPFGNPGLRGACAGRWDSDGAGAFFRLTLETDHGDSFTAAVNACRFSRVIRSGI